MMSILLAALYPLLLMPDVSSSQPPPRTPQYPLKTRRMIVSDSDIARARENVAKYPAARKLADAIIADADYWLAWSDEDLASLITDSRVPRAFAVSASGCPICGAKLKEKRGDYSWIIDPKIPFKVKCPVDGTVFPTNDYDAFYKSGFKDKVGWDTAYVDDGWGWKDPKTGEKFWFVAYWNHWMWHGKLVPGVNALGRAYLLTGDRRYAHKAAVALRKIAQVYPAMDHAKQSRYGTMMAARGVDYAGKVVNLIWEAGLVTSLAEAYDDVWETIDTDTALQKQFNQTGEELRGFIEANLLEDAIDAYFQFKIRGNFGMHQTALVNLALARQFGPQKTWFDALMSQSSPSLSHLGLNYALYNNIYRDGAPMETAPNYNVIWVDKIADYGELLSKAGLAVFQIPRVRRLFDWKLDLICAREFTPSLGDSGDVWGGHTGLLPEAFKIAQRHYDDPRYARYLTAIHAAGEGGFTTWESLFHPPVPASSKDQGFAVQKSRVLDGCGWAVLNNGKDSIAMSLNYGLKAGHGHFDRLSVDLFANHHPMIPDLGYPDAMNEFVPGIYTWSKNTISHNTVTVDAKRQIGNVPGRVRLFADSPIVRVIDVDGDGTYPQCSQYRRAVIMVDVDANQSYFVDVFTAVGGKEHDYSLHGPPGDFKMIGGEWSAAEPGTLAGKDVKLGEIYDQPAMAAPGYSGGYSGYGGSGFQHLFNVQRNRDGGAWVADWKHQRDPESHLRIRVLDQPGQEMLLCDAHVSPAKYPQIVKFLIARRAGEKLASRFVSVIEPYSSKPFIQSARIVERTDHGATVEVVFVGGSKDVISYSDAGGSSQVRVTGFDGSNSKVLEFTASNEAAKAITGRVISIDREKSMVRVRMDHDVDPKSVIGRVVHFQNAGHRTAHPIVGAERDGDLLVLTTRDDLVVGRVKVEGIEPRAIATKTALPLGPIYAGTFLCADGDNSYHAVSGVSAGAGRIELVSPLGAADKIVAGKDAWLVDVGPGDRFEMPAVEFWSKPDQGK